MPSDSSDESDSRSDDGGMQEEKFQQKQPTKTSNYVPQNALNKNKESSEEDSDSSVEEEDKLDDVKFLSIIIKKNRSKRLYADLIDRQIYIST